MNFLRLTAIYYADHN